MKSIDLLRAINDIDDKYIEEAMPLVYKRKTFNVFKLLPIFFVLVLAIFIGVKMIDFDNNSSDTLIGNPIVEYGSLKEAEESVGFSFGANLDEFDNLTYSVINKEILEIRYDNNDEYLICRMGKGEDVSGDFNTYQKVDNVVVNKTNIVIKTNGDIILITFKYDDFAYAFSSNYLSEDSLLKIVKEIVEY